MYIHTTDFPDHFPSIFLDHGGTAEVQQWQSRCRRRSRPFLLASAAPRITPMFWTIWTGRLLPVALLQFHTSDLPSGNLT